MKVSIELTQTDQSSSAAKFTFLSDVDFGTAMAITTALHDLPPRALPR